MSNFLKAFNEHFSEFLADLVKVFPENLDLKTAKMTQGALTTMNPSKLIKVWRNHVIKYADELNEGNISAFIDKDYTSDLNKFDAAQTGEINGIIDRLREPIRNMGEENQQKALKYIQNLNKLCKLYFNNN
jgi:vacuolar-type H+-ATPase subunit C/Vma6